MDQEWVETIEESIQDEFAKYNIHNEPEANVCA